MPPDDGAFSQPALKVLQAAPLLPRRQRPSSAAASARGLPPQAPAVAVALIALAEAVATAPRLATLKLGGNGIGHEGARELCNPSPGPSPSPNPNPNPNPNSNPNRNQARASCARCSIARQA